MQRLSFPYFFIICGSGRKVGKTHLAKALIRYFSVKFPLFALKISPHVHDSPGSAQLMIAANGIRIFREMEPHDKNSGQFLAAGALQSFFMETDDEHLAEAFRLFMAECNPMNYPVICESGALCSLVKPGILIFIADKNPDLPGYKQFARQQADLVVSAKSFSTSEIVGTIGFSNKTWYFIP